MAEQKSEVYFSGLGRIAGVIPKEGWKKAIDTACDTFTDLISPITETTSGLGGLIRAKFDEMIDVQKVFAADAVYRAREKVEKSNISPNPRPSARVLVNSIEQASLESDSDLRDIWANLIANEMSSGDVHPEFPTILARMSAQDAMLLSKIAERNSNKYVKLSARSLSVALGFLGASVALRMDEGSDANHEQLERLALIERSDGVWWLTHFGEKFVRAVTDPGLDED